MKRKILLLVAAAVSILCWQTLFFASLQSCFDQLKMNLYICKRDFGNDPVMLVYCNEGAWVIFNRCVNALRFDQNSQLYGTKIPALTFKRSYGQPVLSAETFTIDEDGVYYFNLYNGERGDQSTKISSAFIQIFETGQTIFSPSDFNKNVDFASKPVCLSAGTYTLNVSIKSQPDSYLILIISDKDFSTITE
ncbi:MAG: hypothetical protein ACE14Q_07935 [Acidobacteriota bacterium]